MTGPEKRIDVLTRRVSLVAPARSKRPNAITRPDFTSHNSQQVLATEFNPFLEGHESKTPAESLSLRKINTQPDQTGWLLRVVPNRYPAVTFDVQPSSKNAATGYHEVVIECPDHRTRLIDLSVSEIARILIAWQQRIHTLSQHPQLQSIHVFRNEGANAGASLSHCHSQIVALDFQPQPNRHQTSSSLAFTKQRQNWVNQQTDGRLNIFSDDQYLVTCPFAPRVSYHVRICQHHSFQAFESLSNSETKQLAHLLKASCVAIHDALGPHAFNVVLHRSTFECHDHWMLEILPRTAQFAGFELSAGVEIVTTAPESAAPILRENWTLELEEDTHNIVPAGYHWTQTQKRQHAPC